jgi:hypothetical protein
MGDGPASQTTNFMSHNYTFTPITLHILTHAPPSPPLLTFGARHSHGCGRLYACSPPGGTQCPPFAVHVTVINTTTSTTTTLHTQCQCFTPHAMSFTPDTHPVTPVTLDTQCQCFTHHMQCNLHQTHTCSHQLKYTSHPMSVLHTTCYIVHTQGVSCVYRIDT